MKKILAILFMIFNISISFATVEDEIINAINNGYIDNVNFYVENSDFDPNMTINNFDTTLLMWVAPKGDTELLNKLINLGADINRLDAEGDSILYYAKKDSSTLNLLINNRMKLDFVDSDGRDIVDIAIGIKDLSIIETAIDEGYASNSILTRGINLKDIGLINLSLDKGANPNQSVTVSDEESRLIIYAYEKLQNMDIVNLLISKGAKIDEEGFSLIDSTLENSDFILLKALIEKEIDVNRLRKIGASKGKSLLYSVMKLDNFEITKLLISKGASILQENEDGASPFDLILVQNLTDVFKLALDNGIDPNSTYKGEQLIHHIAKVTTIDLMELLLNKGVQINAKGSEGKTALMIAASMNNIEMVRKLVANGADIGLKDDNGLRAYDYTDYPEIKDMLKNSKTLYYIIGGIIAFIIALLLVFRKNKKTIKSQDEVVFPDEIRGATKIEEIYNFLQSNRKKLKVTMKNEKIKISSMTRVCYIYINEYKEIVCKEKKLKPMIILMSFIILLLAILMAVFGENEYLVTKPLTYFAIAFVPGIMNPILKNKVEMLLIKYSEKKYNFDISEDSRDINLFNMINKSSWKNKGIIKQIEELIKQGANINARDYEGNTPLMRAISKGNYDVAKLFLDREVELNSKNFRGESALNLATKLGRVEIAKELMDRKVNIEVEDVAFEMPNYK